MTQTLEPRRRSADPSRAAGQAPPQSRDGSLRDPRLAVRRDGRRAGPRRHPVRLDGGLARSSPRPRCAPYPPPGGRRRRPPRTTTSCSPSSTSRRTSSTRRSSRSPSPSATWSSARCSATRWPSCDFPGKKLVFALVLGTLMVPGVVTFVPLFVLTTNIGLTNTLPGMILPFLAGPFGVFLMRQFILEPARRADPGRARRRRRRAADLLLDHPAAVRARGRDARRPHVPHVVEQLPLAARRGHRRRTSTRCRSRSRSTPSARTPRSTACCSPARSSSCCPCSSSSWSCSARSCRASP